MPFRHFDTNGHNHASFIPRGRGQLSRTLRDIRQALPSKKETAISKRSEMAVVFSEEPDQGP